MNEQLYIYHINNSEQHYVANSTEESILYFFKRADLPLPAHLDVPLTKKSSVYICFSSAEL